MIEILRKVLERIAPMNETEWDEFSSGLSVISVPRKTVLCDVGDVSSESYFVLEGALRLYFVKEGDSVSANFFFENEFAACYGSVLTQSPSRQALEALEDSKLVAIPNKHLLQFSEKYPVGVRLLQRLAERGFLILQERASAFILDSPEERYRNLLRDKPQVLQRVPQHYIASYLGIAPESLSRIRKRILK